MQNVNVGWQRIVGGFIPKEGIQNNPIQKREREKDHASVLALNVDIMFAL